jgi:hypothetical protein
MAAVDSPFTSYSDTVPQKRVITDVISLIDPSDAPFIEKIGGLDAGAGKFRFANWPSTKVEWLEDTMAALTSTLQTATIASNATAATVGDASVFQPGHIIKITAQTFWVSAVDLTNNILTMAALGGTGTSHATGTTITIVGLARIEGDDSDPVAFTSRTSNYNFTQIFHHEIKVSRTQAKISQWGIGNEFDYQAQKVIPTLMRLMERHLLSSGTRHSGSATMGRVMGGLPVFITGNTASGVTMTKTSIEEAIQMAWADGGVGPWIAPVSGDNLQKLFGFYENSGYLRIDRTETEVGMEKVNVVHTPFGDVFPLLDRWADSGTIYFVDLNQVGMLTHDAFVQEPLAVDGDYQKGQVIGEFTFVCRQDNAHAVMGGVS